MPGPVRSGARSAIGRRDSAKYSCWRSVRNFGYRRRRLRCQQPPWQRCRERQRAAAERPFRPLARGRSSNPSSRGGSAGAAGRYADHGSAGRNGGSAPERALGSRACGPGPPRAPEPEDETVDRRLSPLVEQLNGRIVQRFGSAQTICSRRNPKGREAQQPFALCSQRLAAGCQNAHARSCPQHRLSNTGCCTGDMLATIENDQHVPVSRPRRERR